MRHLNTQLQFAATGLLCLLAALAVLAGPAQGQILYQDEQKVYRADLDGSNRQSLLAGSSQAVAVDPLGRQLYMVSGLPDRITRINLDGTGRQDILTNLLNPTNLALDVLGNKIYWTEGNGGGRFRRANLDGSDTVKVLADGVVCEAMLVDSAGKKIYFNKGTAGLLSADQTGANPTLIRPGTRIYGRVGNNNSHTVFALDPVDQRLYFVDKKLYPYKLQRIKVKGDSLQDVASAITTVTGVFFPTAFALDVVNRKIYFVAGAKIYRSDLDGRNRVEVVTQQSPSPAYQLEITSLVVSPEQGKLYWTFTLYPVDFVDLSSPLPAFYIRQAKLDGSDAGNLAPVGSSATIFAVLSPSNVAPVLKNNTVTASFSQNLVKDVPQRLGNEVTLSDADTTGYDKGKVSVSYTAGGTNADRLSFGNQFRVESGTLSYSGTAIGTVPASGAGSGADGQSLEVTLNASATPAVVKALIDSLSYQYTGTSPALSRTIALTVTDGKGGTSAPVSVEIKITPNVAPTLSGVASPVRLGQGALQGSPQVLLNSEVRVDDQDSPDFGGGQLRVQYVSGGTAQDVLTLRDQGTGIGQVGFAAQTASYGGRVVGKKPTNGVWAAADGLSGNPLVLDLNTSATPAVVEALIENLALQHQGTGSVTLSIQVDDGDGGTSTASTVVVNVTPNKAPVVTSQTAAVQFGQNAMAAGAQRVGLEVTVRDEDSPDFSGGKLTVSYVESAGPEEVLLLLDGAQVGTASGRVTYAGTEVGTVPTSGAGSGLAGQPLEVTFNPSATAAAVEALIEALGYQNAIPGTRTIQIGVSDGDGGTSTLVKVAVTITPNAAPTLSSSVTAVEFGENKLNAAAQLLGLSSTLSDEDSPDFGGGRLQVVYSQSGRAEDQLGILDLGTSAGNIGVAEGKVTYGGAEIGSVPTEGQGSGLGGQGLVVSFNPQATPQAVRALIDQLSYQNTSDEPAASRSITITVEDGDGGTSTAVSVVISVKAENEGELVHIIDIAFGGGTEVGEGVQAFEASFSLPYGVFATPSGEVYIADTNHQKIRKVDAQGVISTVAGSGQRGFSGDNGPATRAQLRDPRGVYVSSKGEIYIADTNNHRIRKVALDGTISTVVGTGQAGFSPDRGRALQTKLSSPWSVAVGEDGTLYIADTNNHRILLVRTDGRVVAVAGTGVRGFSGDGGRADRARLNSPGSLVVSASGEIFVTDTNNHCIRRISPDGRIVTVAGKGERGFAGDGGLAVQASLTSPRGVALSAAGELFIADTFNNRIRKVNRSGVISTVVGTGVLGSGGDLGPAVDAELGYPFGVAVTAKGELYIADTFNETIRRTRDILVPNGLSPLLVRGKQVSRPRALAATRGVGVDEEGWLVRGLFGQDNQVGLDDFFLLSDQLGKAAALGGDLATFDLDGDGLVTQEDLGVLKNNFGRRTMPWPKR